MRTPRFSVVALLLAAACAHGNSAADEPRHGASAARDGKEEDERGEKRRADRKDERERVDIPKGGRNRGQLAHAGGELPAEQQPREHTPASAETFGTQPDNTRVNERDREKSALTPLDQSENEDDRELTRKVRQTLIKDDALSFTAKNIKIITREGHVTLRGPVNTEAERTIIERAAQNLAGPSHVTNELEISD